MRGNVTGELAVAGEEEEKRSKVASRGVGRGFYTIQRYPRDLARPTHREGKMLYKLYGLSNVLRVKTLFVGFPAYNVGRSSFSVQHFKFREVF